MNKYEEDRPTQPLSGEIAFNHPRDKDGPKVYATLISRDSNYKDIDLSCNDEILIGRHKDCNVVLKEGTISGNHCIITPILKEGDTEPEFFIKDLSTNGTFINDDLLGKNKTRKLMATDEISLVPQFVKKKNNNQNMLTFIFTPKKSNKMDMIGKYQLTQILGTGNFSVVREGLNTETGETYAIKIMDKHKFSSTQMCENMKREIEILSKLKHPNIISVVDIIDTPKNLYIVLELAKGGELFERIMEREKFSEEEARQMFKQLLGAVNYLHSKDIVHRDLKPENILMDNKKDNTIKITDFGLARIVGTKQMMQTQCGTPHYVAPEILNIGNVSMSNGSSNNGYGKEVDSWSLGVILYILLTGCPPWDSDENDDESFIFQQIRSGKVSYPHELFKDISPAAIDLIKKLLTFDPHKRLTVENAQKHDWILNKNTTNKNLHTGSKMKKHQSTIKPEPSSPRKRKLTADTEDTEIDKENDVNIKKMSTTMEAVKKQTKVATRNKSKK